MLMYSEKRRPREGRAPCLGEPHRIRPSEGTGLPRHGPERFRCSWAEKAPLFFLPTCRSPPKPPSRSSLPSASCPHRSTSSGPAVFPGSRPFPTPCCSSALPLRAFSRGGAGGSGSGGGRKWGGGCARAWSGGAAAMAERVEQRLEDRVPELEQLERVGLFTHEEIRWGDPRAGGGGLVLRFRCWWPRVFFRTGLSWRRPRL